MFSAAIIIGQPVDSRQLAVVKALVDISIWRSFMRVSLRRQFLFLRVYAIATSLVFIVLAAAAFRQAGTPQNLGEIKVERINVVNANGTLRMVISNKDRMHPGVFDGKMIDRPRPVAGMIFFNDEGDEAGGWHTRARSAMGFGTPTRGSCSIS